MSPVGLVNKKRKIINILFYLSNSFTWEYMNTKALVGVTQIAF